MLSKKLLFATLSLSATIFAQDLIAKEHKNYDVSAFGNFRSLPVNAKACDRTQQLAGGLFPGWAITTDKLSGAITDIYGSPIALPGSSDAERAQSCMATLTRKLGITTNEWQFVSNMNAPKAGYVNYKQVVNGHNVVFSRLSFRFTKDGDLARIQARTYGSPANIAPKLTKDEAKDAATKDLPGVTITGAQIMSDWSWFPIPSAGGYTLHPAWQFKVTGRAEGSIPLKLTGYIDAMDGTILYRSNEVKETGFDLHVKGMVYRDGTLNPATLEPLTDLGVTAGFSTVFTDATGLASDISVLLPISADVPLAGNWSTVVDDPTGTTPTFSSLVSLPGTTYTYPTTLPSSSRHVNAYYHVNRIHNFMKGYFPAFFDMDFSLPTNVDVSGSCNAFYDGTAINFFQAGSGCNSFAELGDVIYHEYGHGISDHFYVDVTGSSITNGALNEANSDIWALSITHSAIMANNAFTGGGFIRRYDMTPQVYPIDIPPPFFVDPHTVGQIIAGAWWDVGVNLGSVETMTQLFTDVYFDAPDGPGGTEGPVFQSILIDALMADDDNANLADGTPHYNKIVAAFARHGIYLEGDATLLHTELANQPAGTAIGVSAQLSITNTTYFHDLTMYYRINGAGAWTPVVLTSSLGGIYGGTIPAQPEGNVVEYYFAIHDAHTTPNAYFPITCNDAMPASQTTIPYQFGVGIDTTSLGNTFESNTTGWGVGSNPGDNAAIGKWARVTPIAATSLSAWPSANNTAGGVKCLLTGNGSSSGFGGTDVTTGTTTVLTPSFNIAPFTAPVVEYYRWFSNETGDNFKNDPWKVQIKDAAASTWQTVEFTYQADDQWRRRIFPVSAYLPAGTTHIQMKFFASDSVLTGWSGSGQSTTVGGLDDFFIYDKASAVPSNGVNQVATLKPTIYPNPANDQVNITVGAGSTGTIDLYDMAGKKVAGLQVSAAAGSYTIGTKDLAAGPYNVLIQTDKCILSKKVIVIHQ